MAFLGRSDAVGLGALTPAEGRLHPAVPNSFVWQ
jgi:hypothetical protein